MDKTQHYIRQIHFTYPELAIDSACINRDGQYNDVLVVNDELIFRFAKVPDAIATLQNEVALLRYLQERISLPIPHPTYVNIEGAAIGEAFVGYPMIPGIPLWRPNFRKITKETVRKHMAEQLAEFLKELHSTPLNELPVTFEPEETLNHWIDMYAQIQAKLFPAMRPDARKAVTIHFEDFFANKELSNFVPRLCHGDFGTGNLLFDFETQSIAGVIDFGGAGVGDPAGDFAGLYISFGEEFYRHCYSVYPEMEPALERVKFFCGTFALQEALFGFDNKDEVAYRAGMEQYV